MHYFDIMRRQVEFRRERAQRFRRYLTLFIIADVCTIVKIITFYDHPLWFLALAFGLVVSVFLVIWLLFYERIRKQQLKIIKEGKNGIINERQNMGLHLFANKKQESRKEKWYEILRHLGN